MIPAATNPHVKSVVATGRRINGVDRLISEIDPRVGQTGGGAPPDQDVARFLGKSQWNQKSDINRRHRALRRPFDIDA
jgi:hypothetical protein